jgi:hypothetical protein
MKIGRNAPCPCGSGKKYKRCCGDPTKPKALPWSNPSNDKVVQERAQNMGRAHKAVEKVRQQQQGYGHPIVSTEHSGYRLVAVGSTVHWHKNWRVFPDFLLYFLKKTLGSEWGIREQENKSPHPIFRWLAKFNEYTAKYNRLEGQVMSGPLVGFMSCTFHLA